MIKTSKSLVCIFFAATLVACTQPTKQKTVPNVNLSGFPPEYQAGYVDGCNSVSNKNEIKDRKRFAKDNAYATGWRDGYDICSKRQ